MTEFGGGCGCASAAITKFNDWRGALRSSFADRRPVSGAGGGPANRVWKSRREHKSSFEAVSDRTACCGVGFWHRSGPHRGRNFAADAGYRSCAIDVGGSMQTIMNRKAARQRTAASSTWGDDDSVVACRAPTSRLQSPGSETKQRHGATQREELVEGL